MTTLGHLLLARFVPLLVVTTALLGGALLLDRLLERRVSASLRLLLYLPVIARVWLPLGWTTPLGLVRPVPHAEVIVLEAASPPPAAGAGTLGEAAVGVTYLLVALALLGRWGWARIALGLAVRRARPLPGTAPAATRRVPILVHPELGPVVVGLWRTRIVVPEGLVEPEHGEAMGLVLRHEAAHVVRRDPLLGAAVQLATIVAWPMVPVWIAAGRVRALMELACDERALAGANGRARRRYAEILVALAAARPLTPAAGLAFGSSLMARVRALKGARRWPRAAQVGVVGALAALVLACTAAPPAGKPGGGDVPPPLGGPSAAADDAEPSPATVRGSLDAAGVGGVIRAHIGEVKACYDAGLERDPTLAGRIVLGFSIGPTGEVVRAALESTTLHDGEVESCTLIAVRGWRFPRPEPGATVTITYPFVFTPA